MSVKLFFSWKIFFLFVCVQPNQSKNLSVEIRIKAKSWQESFVSKIWWNVSLQLFPATFSSPSLFWLTVKSRTHSPWITTKKGTEGTWGDQEPKLCDFMSVLQNRKQMAEACVVQGIWKRVLEFNKQNSIMHSGIKELIIDDLKKKTPGGGKENPRFWREIKEE